MFDLLLQKFSDLRHATALIEACDWDEEVASNAVKSLGEAMDSFSGGNVDQLKIHVTKQLSTRVVRCLLETIDNQLPSAINIDKEEIN
jgi:hypothetical protein